MCRALGRPEGRSPLQDLFGMLPLVINGLRAPARQKKRFPPPVAEVGLICFEMPFMAIETTQSSHGEEYDY